MPRLVGVKVLCDHCNCAQALLYNPQHHKALCKTCSQKYPVSKQIDLTKTLTTLAFCAYCDRAPAVVFCESQAVALCSPCEDGKHRTITHLACRIHVSIEKAFGRTISLTGSLNKRAEEERPNKTVRKRPRVADELQVPANNEKGLSLASLDPMRSSNDLTQEVSELSQEPIISMDLDMDADIINNDVINFDTDVLSPLQATNPSISIENGVDNEFADNYLNLPRDKTAKSPPQSPRQARKQRFEFTNHKRLPKATPQPLPPGISDEMPESNSMNTQMPYYSPQSIHATVATAVSASREMDDFLRRFPLAELEQRISIQASMQVQKLATDNSQGLYYGTTTTTGGGMAAVPTSPAVSWQPNWGIGNTINPAMNLNAVEMADAGELKGSAVGVQEYWNAQQYLQLGLQQNGNVRGDYGNGRGGKGGRRGRRRRTAIKDEKGLKN